jgi:hypothetical protein
MDSDLEERINLGSSELTTINGLVDIVGRSLESNWNARTIQDLPKGGKSAEHTISRQPAVVSQIPSTEIAGEQRMNETNMVCNGCGAPNPEFFFELPRLPGSVGMLAKSVEEARAATCGEVKLVVCDRCGLIQNQLYDVSIVGFVPGYEVSLFHTPTFRTYIQGVCDHLIERYDLRGRKILEIDCGGAEFLRLICHTGGNHGVGVDPTIVEPSTEQLNPGSIQLVPGYFSKEHDPYIGDFICCLSVFEDIPKPLEFLVSLRESIGDRDVPVYLEIFNGYRSIQQKEVWSIHYEQCNYFSLASLTGMFERAGFEVTDSGSCYERDQYIFVEARPGDSSSTPSRPNADFTDVLSTARDYMSLGIKCEMLVA